MEIIHFSNSMTTNTKGVFDVQKTCLSELYDSFQGTQCQHSVLG